METGIKMLDQISDDLDSCQIKIDDETTKRYIMETVVGNHPLTLINYLRCNNVSQKALYDCYMMICLMNDVDKIFYSIFHSLRIEMTDADDYFHALRRNNKNLIKLLQANEYTRYMGPKYTCNFLSGAYDIGLIYDEVKNEQNLYRVWRIKNPIDAMKMSNDIEMDTNKTTRINFMMTHFKDAMVTMIDNKDQIYQVSVYTKYLSGSFPKDHVITFMDSTSAILFCSMFESVIEQINIYMDI